MEAPSELLRFPRHFCKLSPTFVILVLICFDNVLLWEGAYLKSVMLHRCFSSWPQRPWWGTAGAECKALYNVVLIKQKYLVGRVLEGPFLWYGLKKSQQKILRVLLGMESYLNVMLWILRSLKRRECHSWEGILRSEGGECTVMAWVELESHFSVTNSTELSLRLAEYGFSVVQEQAQHLLAKARESGSGCSS